MSRFTFVGLLFCCVLAGSPTAYGTGTTGYYQAWAATGWNDRQDYATVMQLGPQGNVYLGGRSNDVYGLPDDQPDGGVAASFDSSGNHRWLSKAYPEDGLDHVLGLAVDASGSVYISGETYRYAAGAEAFLVKFSADGSRLWERHLGSPDNEFGRGVAVDSSGNVYVTGSTTGLVGSTDYRGYDAYVAKYSSSGERLWTEQFDDEFANFGDDLAIGGGDQLYLSGSGQGATLASLSLDGDVLWKRSPNYSEIAGRTTSISSTAADADGFVYTAGSTNQLYDNARGFVEGDLFVTKHAPDGDMVWQTVIAGPGVDGATDVAVDSSGKVYFAGYSNGGAGGSVRSEIDARWGVLSPTGDLLLDETYGTERNDAATGIDVDEFGRVYLAGSTSWSVGRYFAAEADVFLVRFDPIPEPTTQLLASLFCLGSALRHRALPWRA
ncbi:MAG: SBBP repeat-containing protein [Planctomycetota bacterium]